MIKKRLEKIIEPREVGADTYGRRNSLNAVEPYVPTKDLIEKEDANKSTNIELDKSTVNYLILDFSGINQCDSDGVKVIKQLIDDFRGKNIPVFICQFQGFKLFQILRFQLRND